MKRTVGVIGGDRRQAELARLLSADGHKICTYGLERWGADGAAELETAMDAEVLVLPLPLCRGEELLNCEGVDFPVRNLFRCLSPGQKLLAGQIRPQQIQEAKECGLQLEDYFQREEVAVANAAVTAEAAIQVALERLERSIRGMECLVIGFGRIGKLLSRALDGLGARVTVSARSSVDFAWIRAYGWKSVRTDTLEGALNNFGVVFNTVPSLVLDERLLCQLPRSCLCVDLASVPGIDLASAEKLGLPNIWARALPGKLKPCTAAKILYDSIHNILLEG